MTAQCGDCSRLATDPAPKWECGASVWGRFCCVHAEARMWGWQRFGWKMP